MASVDGLRTMFLAVLLAIAGGCGASDRVSDDCAYCPEMIPIPAGRFLMGSTPDETVRAGMPRHHAEVEWPQHEVSIEEPVLIGRYEVTRAEYAHFAEQTERPARECLVYEDKRYQPAAGSSWRNPPFAQDDDHPVICVDWDDANAYTEWLSDVTGHRYRLPSEAEWEYAARAGSVGDRYWNARNGDACAHANVADRESPRPQFECVDPYPETAPVNYGIANDAGLFGMLGNVGEWVADCGLPSAS